MHEIEPYYSWLDYYDASRDKLSPFFAKEYSEFEFSNKIYNYYIHPRWDFFGSSTMYCKILFADYESSFAIIELIGEWNDAVHNDIMEIKNGLINPLIENGIRKFVLIGENVLNFHASDELYYEEWFDEIKEDGGWIALFNFKDYVVEEMRKARIDHYVNMGDTLGDIAWRKFKPANIVDLAENQMIKSFGDD